MVLLAVGIGVAIIVIAVAIGLAGNKKLVESGQIINRGTRFMESAEIFTLNTPDPAAVSSSVKSFAVYEKGVSMKGSTADQIYTFNGGSWAAKLKMMSSADGKSVYRFEFTSWKTSNGMPQDAINMNRLITSVEKMFLAFDPNTQVSTEALDFKTKHSLF